MKPPENTYGTASHRVVTHTGVAPPDAWVRAENAVLETLLSAGLTVHVALAELYLERSAPEVYEVLTDRPAPDYSPLATTQPTVELTPGDADLPGRHLSVDPTTEAVPTWREQAIGEIVAFDRESDRWVYYSVPRKTAVRAVDEPTAAEKSSLRSALADVPCTALFPHGALAKWEVADVAVELTVEGLWLGRADGTTRWYPHEQLEGVVVDEGACELLLSWPAWRDEADSSLGRLVRGIVDRVRESPPRLLHPPDEQLLSTAATAFELISDRLCYDFEVRRHDGDTGTTVAGRLR